MFKLHPQLEADTLKITDWDLCTLRLMNDARYPWIILVPRRDAVREFHRLDAPDQIVLWEEIRQAARALEAATGAEKMNVAALGNMVPQLHVHIIARFSNDAAWPGPIWGVGKAVPYETAQAKERISKFLSCL